MKRVLKITVIVMLSVGWLFPAWAALYMFITYFDEEVSDLLHGHEPMTSFPFLVEAQQWATVAFLWLGLALLFWSVAGATRLFPKERIKE